MTVLTIEAVELIKELAEGREADCKHCEDPDYTAEQRTHDTALARRVANAVYRATRLMLVPVFTIDELEAKARAKAIDDLRYMDVQFEGWANYVLEEWKKKLAAFGFDDAEIEFSGFASQGDGASFTCSSIDVLKWIKAVKREGDFPKTFAQLTPDQKIDVDASVHRSDASRYVHERTVHVSLELSPCDEDPDQDENDAILDALSDHVRALSKEMYRALENEHDGFTTDENVVESIRANDLLFAANGGQAVATGHLEEEKE